MSLFNKVATAVTLFGFSTWVLAHSGHDHSAWDSALQHVLFYGAIASLALYFGVRSLLSYRSRARQEEDNRS